MNILDRDLSTTYRQILNLGLNRNAERTGVGTKSKFGLSLDFYYEGQSILLASQLRPIAIKSAIAETLWILKGKTDLKWLEDHGVKYWKAWANEQGQLGKIYGYQLRNFESQNGTCDQLTQVIKGLKENPEGRRHIISLWNPANLSEMALPPCHLYSQFYVNCNFLDLMVVQRSADMILGVPHDLVIYSLIQNLVARELGLAPGRLLYHFGDAHIYNNHIDAAWELVKRADNEVLPDTFPKIKIMSNKNIFDIEPEDIIVQDYNPLPKLDKKFDLTVAV